MGFFSRSEPSTTEEDKPFSLLAEELGLGFQPSKRGFGPSIRGEVDGHRLKVAVAPGFRNEISVKFNSGLNDLSIRSRSRNLRTNRVDVQTGDQTFDQHCRLLLRPTTDAAQVLEYLTPQRREIILALEQAFDLDEIEEGELEVRFGETPSADELREAISVVLLAATALDS